MKVLVSWPSLLRIASRHPRLPSCGLHTSLRAKATSWNLSTRSLLAIPCPSSHDTPDPARMFSSPSSALVLLRRYLIVAFSAFC
ncbi:hypothetical protein BD309DRAFT_968920 [Dichomitus squalens]|uniref:Uncharacterized protein n=1 Tax=Dichomitus squalens TaxID=114155 RepID=A0A4V2K3A4_9APHY|nr:hypothetical protein BD309DRAFT_968920 [Dichomitus squalens]TBU52370.1 hypothetical protein BD310DRAFT_862006 [Dichomitus squalens]